ncbi:hypothetical protein BGZ73_003556 [Actinomortierella ambigua]|nr:hypothetical protein BGZ73_003556 [Actinomortierella ambigua]
MDASWGAKLSLLGDSTLVTIYERNRCKANGLGHESQDKTINKNLSRLKEGIQELEADLSRSEEEGALSSKELKEREDTLISLQQQVEKLEALFQDQDNSNAREILMGRTQTTVTRTSTRTVRFSDTVVETDDLDNTQMLQLQQRIVEDQDAHLDRLSESLGRQQEVGLMIGEELDSHVVLLDESEHLVDRTAQRLGHAGKRLANVVRKTKGCGSWLIILALVIILVIVIRI